MLKILSPSSSARSAASLFSSSSISLMVKSVMFARVVRSAWWVLEIAHVQAAIADIAGMLRCPLLTKGDIARLFAALRIGSTTWEPRLVGGHFRCGYLFGDWSRRPIITA